MLVFLEGSVVNVALPAITTALGLTAAGAAWVVTAYLLTFGGLQLDAGRMADLYGRRRMFQIGSALFTAASLAAAFAPDAVWLIAARAVQGIGGAIVIPAQLALLSAIFTEPAAYRKAFAVWSAMGAAGAAIGVSLGGVLTDQFGWPAIFLINVPIGLLVLIASARILPADATAQRGSGNLDPIGALSGTTGLLALVYLASELPGRGIDAVTLAAAALTAACAAVFVRNQRRSPAPVVPNSLLRLREVRAGSAASFILGAAHVPAFVLITVMLQDHFGYSAMAAGFAVLPIALVNLVIARTVVPKAMERYGARLVLAAGMALQTAGLTGYALFLTPGASYLTVILPISLVFAIGLPPVFVGATAPVLRAAPEADKGAASGVVNTVQRLGASLGLTAALIVAANVGGTTGLRIDFAVAALLAALGVVVALAWYAPRPRSRARGNPIDDRESAIDRRRGRGMRIVILGGYGTVGREAAALLLAGGANVVLAGRDPAKAVPMPGATLAQVDCADPTQVAAILDGVPGTTQSTATMRGSTSTPHDDPSRTRGSSAPPRGDTRATHSYADGARDGTSGTHKDVGGQHERMTEQHDRAGGQHERVDAVLMCAESHNGAVARACFERGIHYLDVTASRAVITEVEALHEVAVANNAVGVLSVGLIPGVSNLLARMVIERSPGAEIRIGALLGSGEAHRRAAIRWTLDGLGSLSGSWRMTFPQGRRTVHRFPFSDQYTLPATLGGTGVRTGLALDSRPLTALLAAARRPALGRLMRGRVAEAALARVHVGSDRFAVKVESDSAGAWFTGRRQSRATGVVAALLAERVHRFPPGVRHIEQLVDPVEFLADLHRHGFTAGHDTRNSSGPRSV
ncbi:MFS transporter [Nocardia crassostreae]|uniref:MFS transporter n=1 Tax=Nocardia crassostreae TaxID=53428 RepID=UPI0008363CF4|nr:MFS transporter [Nocardia crassostreae]